MSDGLPPSMTAILAPPAQPEQSVFTEQPQRRVQFLTTGVTPPSDLYIGPDDSIRVELYAQNAGILIHVKMRFVSAAGDMMYEDEQLTTVALPATASQDYRMGEGFLLSVALSADSAINARGRVFASVSYIRAFGSSSSSYMHTLVQGYVAATQRVSWPVIQTDWAVNGQGLIAVRSFGPQPAGSNFTFTTGNQVRTRLMSIVCIFTTSATVANRYVYFVATSGTLQIAHAASSNGQAAGISQTYSCAPGYPTAGAEPGAFTVPWPIDFRLQPGMAITVGAISMQATDQFTQMQMATE